MAAGGNMAHFHYQLVPCPKCKGEFYGPVGVTVKPELPLAQQLRIVENELASTHPRHLVNGNFLKRYSDGKLPEY